MAIVISFMQRQIQDFRQEWALIVLRRTQTYDFVKCSQKNCMKLSKLACRERPRSANVLFDFFSISAEGKRYRKCAKIKLKKKRMVP